MIFDTVAKSFDFSKLVVPGPTPTALSAPFWEAVAQGRLQLQGCADCAALAAYPREVCPYCWSTNRTWTAVSGMAHVRTFTLVHQAGNPGWQVATPYYLGLVQLVEGPVILTHLLTEGRTPTAGDPCRVTFTQVADWKLPFFALSVDQYQHPSGAPS